MDSAQITSLVTALEKFHDLDPKMPIRQVIYLLTLAQQKEPVGISEMADLVGVGVAVASRYAASYGRGGRTDAGLGFLVAKEDPNDWRKKQLVFTDTGRKFIENLFEFEDKNAHIQEGK